MGAGLTSAGATSRWLPIAGFTLLASANQMLWLNFTPITTGSAAHLHVSKSAIGTLSEVFPLLYVVLAVPVGRALDRWLVRTLIAGAVMTAGGAWLRVGGRTYGWILAGQVVIALAQPAILSAITAIATRYLHEHHRPMGIAVGSAGTFVGFILAFVVGGALGAGRLHSLMLVSAVYATVCSVLVAITLRVGGARETVGALASGSMRELLDDPVMRTLTALVFLGFGVFIALTTWVETLLHPAHVTSGRTDVLLTVMVVAGVIGSVVIPPPAATRRLQAVVIIASGAAIAAGCALLAAAPGVAIAAVALTMIGLLVLPDLPVVLELAERRAGSSGATATAMLWLSGNLGGIVVALVIQGVQGTPTLAFSILAVIGLAAVPLGRRLGGQLARYPSEDLEPA